MCNKHKQNQDALAALKLAAEEAYDAVQAHEAGLIAEFTKDLAPELSAIRAAVGVPQTLEPKIRIDFYTGRYCVQFFVKDRALLTFYRPVPVPKLEHHTALYALAREKRESRWSAENALSFDWVVDAVNWAKDYPSLRPLIDAVKAEVDRISAERSQDD